MGRKRSVRKKRLGRKTCAALGAARNKALSEAAIRALQEAKERKDLAEETPLGTTFRGCPLEWEKDGLCKDF